MTRRLSILLALGAFVAGCGSSSNGSSASSTQQRGPGFANDPKVVACLKKQGITPPTRRGGPPANGAGGTPPANGQPNAGNSARFQTLRAALQKCGVQFNGRPPGGGGGTPPTTTTS